MGTWPAGATKASRPCLNAESSESSRRRDFVEWTYRTTRPGRPAGRVFERGRIDEDVMGAVVAPAGRELFPSEPVASNAVVGLAHRYLIRYSTGRFGARPGLDLWFGHRTSRTRIFENNRRPDNIDSERRRSVSRRAVFLVTKILVSFFFSLYDVLPRRFHSIRLDRRLPNGRQQCPRDVRPTLSVVIVRASSIRDDR